MLCLLLAADQVFKEHVLPFFGCGMEDYIMD